MNLEYLKEKKEYVSIVLLGLSVLIGIFIVYTVTDFYADTARAENIVSTAIEQINSESINVDQYFTKDREVARTLTRNNLFVPEAVAENPVQEVRAIFGDQVLINNRWYGEGDTIPGNATVVSIEATHVEIEWNGSRSTLRPLDASIPQTQQSERTVARGTGRESPDMVVIGSQSSQLQDRRGTLDSLRQRFQNMSDAERTRLRNEMRQQFGGNFGNRGGGFFGGGRGNFGGGRGNFGGGRGGRGGGGRGGRGG